MRLSPKNKASLGSERKLTDVNGTIMQLLHLMGGIDYATSASKELALRHRYGVSPFAWKGSAISSMPFLRISRSGKKIVDRIKILRRDTMI